ncbi:MAG: hypothetical protein WB586_01405 [Chthoniobacterales bacterium]
MKSSPLALEQASAGAGPPTGEAILSLRGRADNNIAHVDVGRLLDYECDCARRDARSDSGKS